MLILYNNIRNFRTALYSSLPKNNTSHLFWMGLYFHFHFSIIFTDFNIVFVYDFFLLISPQKAENDCRYVFPVKPVYFLIELKFTN